MITKKEDAVFDDNQLLVLSQIDPFTTGMDLIATRGHSTPQEQLATIAKFANANKVSFPEFVPGGPVDLKINIPGVGLVYHWQRTWSRLLSLGVVVNPPAPAVCLDDYTRPTGECMKGKVLQGSTHVYGESDGMYPMDFSQRVNGTPNIILVNRILMRAQAAGAGIQFLKMEKANGCVHAGTLKVTNKPALNA